MLVKNPADDKIRWYIPHNYRSRNMPSGQCEIKQDYAVRDLLEDILEYKAQHLD